MTKAEAQAKGWTIGTAADIYRRLGMDPDAPVAWPPDDDGGYAGFRLLDTDDGERRRIPKERVKKDE